MNCQMLMPIDSSAISENWKGLDFFRIFHERLEFWDELRAYGRDEADKWTSSASFKDMFYLRWSEYFPPEAKEVGRKSAYHSGYAVLGDSRLGWYFTKMMNDNPAGISFIDLNLSYEADLIMSGWWSAFYYRWMMLYEYTKDIANDMHMDGKYDICLDCECKGWCTEKPNASPGENDGRTMTDTMHSVQ